MFSLQQPPAVWIIATAALVVFALYVVVSVRRSARGLGTAGIGASPKARRSNVLTNLRRTAIAALLLALLVSGFWLSRKPDIATHRSVSCRSSGVVIVDMSGSTAEDTLSLAKMGRVLKTLTSNPRSRIGLVMFSDDAYEVFPPCTKPEAFRRMIDQFIHPKRKTVSSGTGFGSYQTTTTINPWANTFIGGTSISLGLDVALRAYLRTPHVAGAPIVLISDLENGEGEGVLEGVLDAYRHFGIPLRIFEMNGISGTIADHRRVYKKHVENLAFGIDRHTFPSTPLQQSRVSGSISLSRLLPAIVIVLLIVLAASEHRSQLHLRSTTDSRKEGKR